MGEQKALFFVSRRNGSGRGDVTAMRESVYTVNGVSDKESNGAIRLGRTGQARYSRAFEILKPGRNCWRVAQASRAAVLVDGENYFAAVQRALEAATRSVLIVAWDFDGAIRLTPQNGGEQLGPFLRELVERRPELEIRILVWNLATFHAPSATLPLLLGERWNDHPRITLKLDGDHPLYAAQHEKIVAIDDRVAFVGGIDLTVDRWDTNAHTADDERRRTPEGKLYGPVHDMHLLVEGDAARAVAECARDHWRIVTGETVSAVETASGPWPADLPADFTEVPVAISRTRPTWRRKEGIFEIAQLTRDAIARARDAIYIEAQYFTDFELGEVISRRLQEPDGPEVIVVVTRTMHSFFESLIMNGNRRRLIRKLRRADRHKRLQIYHPVVPGSSGDCEVLIHAKLLIVDDMFLRIGSSNFNNRSAGLDMECDLAIEAETDAHRAAVATVRARLLAEHMNKDVGAVKAAIAAAGGSIIKAVDKLNHGARGLRGFQAPEVGPTTPIFGTALLDPREPLPILSWARGWRRMHRRLPRSVPNRCG
jgi:phosphatidylserine/phosphatidylglycerophosphate/cardiolipin synthase-like enzyme